MHRLNKAILPRYATDYFACSKLAGEWLFPKSFLENDKVCLIHNALDLTKFLPSVTERDKVREELGIADKVVVGHVGRFEEQKNHQFLIDIFYELSKEREDAVLLLIGEGPLREEIEEKVKQYGLKEKVRFLGVRSDVPRLWKAMDMFLFPSLFEGLPIVALEAQASGVYSIMADSITSEVKITDDVKFISLNQDAKYWKNEILKNMDVMQNCKDNELIKNQFREAGYDIISAADELMKYYSI